jgi:hypothetical protein
VTNQAMSAERRQGQHGWSIQSGDRVIFAGREFGRRIEGFGHPDQA